MSTHVPQEVTLIDVDKIRDNIISGGLARKVAPHNTDIIPGSEKFEWNVRDDKVFLQVRQDWSNARRRSQIGYRPIRENVMVIKDGLEYQHYEKMIVDRGKIPYDKQQAILAEYFFEREDMLFFANDPMARPGGWTGVANANASPTAGTHFSTTWGATALNVTTLDLFLTTLGYGVGQLIDGMDQISPYPLILVLAPDAYKDVLYLKDENGTALKQALELLKTSGNGMSAIYQSKWLGATIDYKKDGSYSVTNGTNTAALMAWGQNNYEVATSGLQAREDINDVDGLRLNMEEGYLPISYYPESIIYEAAVADS